MPERLPAPEEEGRLQMLQGTTKSEKKRPGLEDGIKKNEI